MESRINCSFLLIRSDREITARSLRVNKSREVPVHFCKKVQRLNSSQHVLRICKNCWVTHCHREEECSQNAEQPARNRQFFGVRNLCRVQDYSLCYIRIYYLTHFKNLWPRMLKRNSSFSVEFMFDHFLCECCPPNGVQVELPAQAYSESIPKYCKLHLNSSLCLWNIG